MPRSRHPGFIPLYPPTGLYIQCLHYDLINLQKTLPTNWSTLTFPVCDTVLDDLLVVTAPLLYFAYRDATLFFCWHSCTSLLRYSCHPVRTYYCLVCISEFIRCGDTQANVQRLRSGLTKDLHWSTALPIFIVTPRKHISIMWICSTDNPADPLTRIHI